MIVIDREKEKIIGIVVTVLVAIEMVLFILVMTGAFKESIKTATDLSNYIAFQSKVTQALMPAIIACLALIPILYEDMKPISYVSFGLSLVCLAVILFTEDGLDSNFLTDLCLIDLLILIMCTIRTSSRAHSIFKIISFIWMAIAIFVIYPPFEEDTKSVTYTTMEELEKAREEAEAKQTRTYTMIGISALLLMLNPCVALITEDGEMSYGNGNLGTNHRESPLDMFKRLTTQQQQQPPQPVPPMPPGPMPAGAPAPQPAAPAAQPAPAAPAPQIGPNSGAVINPLAQQPAAPVAPAPAEATPAPAPAPEPAPAPAEQFEAPPQMAFLLDNGDQTGHNNP